MFNSAAVGVGGAQHFSKLRRRSCVRLSLAVWGEGRATNEQVPCTALYVINPAEYCQC